MRSYYSPLVYLVVFLLFTTNLSAQKKTVGLTKHLNGGLENGYVLFSPMGSDTIYAINKCGKKVHYWVSEYPTGFTFHLMPNGHIIKAGIYDDTAFGISGGRGGIIEELDWDSKVIWRYKVFNDSLCQHHDIKPLPNGNILVLAWHAISNQKALDLGRDTHNLDLVQNELWGERIIELKPIGSDSAEVVWQWDVFDHVVQDVNPNLPSYGVISQYPELIDINYGHNLQSADWIHANSLDYNAKLNQIVISCYNMSEIWIIDHSTTEAQARSHSGGLYGQGGDLLYRWGNPEAYKTGLKGSRTLYRQHDAQWIPDGMKDSGCILLFNNGPGRDVLHSSVDVIKTPVRPDGTYVKSLPFGPSAADWTYADSVPQNFYSATMSGAQRLSNGNTLICSAVQGRLFEVTQQKKIVWEYRNPATSGYIQSDGQTPGYNSVFRCSFYPANYPAFNQKNLTPGSTIERNSYIYSCNYETVPPGITMVSPSKNEDSVALNAPLKITFNEPVLKRNGNIRIFQNKQLLETINLGSDSIRVVSNQIIIGRSKLFSSNSRISVLVPAGCFRDSSNNLSKLLDSSQWHFYSVKNHLDILSRHPENMSVNVRPDVALELRFKDSVFKSKEGFIQIFEDNALKETINVVSPAVVVSGSLVKIQPQSSFGFDSEIEVQIDTCFRNKTGNYNSIIPLSSWVFRTIGLPQAQSLFPGHRSMDQPIDSDLEIEFDRLMILGKPGKVKIYENNVLKDSFSMNTSMVKIEENRVKFNLGKGFNRGVRVAVAIDKETLLDTNGYYFSGIDSSKWVFHTEKESGLSDKFSSRNEVFSIVPNPSQGLYRISSERPINPSAIRIVDMSGRLICPEIRINDDSVSMDLSEYENGIYYMEIRSDSQVFRYILVLSR